MPLMFAILVILWGIAGLISPWFRTPLSAAAMVVLTIAMVPQAIKRPISSRIYAFLVTLGGGIYLSFFGPEDASYAGYGFLGMAAVCLVSLFLGPRHS